VLRLIIASATKRALQSISKLLVASGQKTRAEIIKSVCRVPGIPSQRFEEVLETVPLRYAAGFESGFLASLMDVSEFSSNAIDSSIVC